jgi:hypothetical protein
MSALVEKSAGSTEIGPDDGLCAGINALLPGEELVLRPGEYKGPCRVRAGGVPGKPIVIRARDLNDRPRIVFEGSKANVLEVRADYVTLRGLQFGPTQSKVDAVRIFGRRGITVEDCSFYHVGGIAIVANHFSSSELTIRRNTILASGATAMYFGCHNGLECEISELLIEHNFIDRVDAPDPEIGYGIQVKLNSAAIIRDNIILNTKGPGIMIYGCIDEAKVSVIERNFTAASRNSSGILLGGGSALVRNNVSVANGEAGIGIQDYGKRGLLRGITVVYNTVYNNEKGGILVTDGKVIAGITGYNAAHARAGTPPFPMDQPGLLQVANMDCSLLTCFVDPEDRNFSPRSNSVLVENGKISDETWVPQNDFFGRARKSPPAVGAIEPPGDAIVVGVKP